VTEPAPPQAPPAETADQEAPPAKPARKRRTKAAAPAPEAETAAVEEASEAPEPVPVPGANNDTAEDDNGELRRGWWQRTFG